MLKKIAVVFGGRSDEHQVSLMSAKNVWEALDCSKYEKIPLAITRAGNWMLPDPSLRYLNGENEAVESKHPLNQEVLDILFSCDLVFPVLHGPYCEDGTLQGFFETLNIPYVTTSHIVCGVAMDKTLTKQIFIANNLPTANFIFFSANEWKRNRERFLNEVENKLHYPLFVKPAYLGSSVGVSRVTNQKELIEGIETAFSFNDKLLVEEEIKGRELEFALFGNDEIYTYPPGEILKGDQHYHFDVKYGENAFKVNPQAEIDEKTLEIGKEIALQAYRAIGCSVYARCDLFLDQNNRWWMNEINTIPGFTNTSMVPQITNHHGISMTALLDTLITLALDD